MNWYKKANDNNIEIESVLDDFGDVNYEASEQAHQLSTDVDLGITRDRELYEVVRDLQGKVIAALWVSFDGGNYEFDVAVAKAYQGRGIGSALINSGVEGFEQGQYTDINDNATMKLHVTSDISRKALERRGFSVIQELPGGDVIMERL